MSRIILKLSGEALAGPKGKGFDLDTVKMVAGQVRQLVEAGHDIGIVIGGGNFWRGRTGNEIDRVKADQIGIEKISEKGKIMSSERVKPYEEKMKKTIEHLTKDLVNEEFEKGTVIFFAGGTGHPYFSTDTGVVLRAIEVEAEVILLAKNIDGVYDSDPAVNPDARRYGILPIDDVISQNLQAVDMTASILARDNKMPMRVFALQEENSIVKAASGDFNGTTIIV